jgi:hypothetical protein
LETHADPKDWNLSSIMMYSWDRDTGVSGRMAGTGRDDQMGELRVGSYEFIQRAGLRADHGNGCAKETQVLIQVPGETERSEKESK